MSFLGSLFSTRKPASADETKKTALDMVTYAASLVSNPNEIDPIIDEVRVITANLGPEQIPSAQDSQKLLGVYLRIEAYLTTKEPIRAFTKQELRTHFAPELLRQLEAEEMK